jgi:hypothetical protein
MQNRLEATIVQLRESNANAKRELIKARKDGEANLQEVVNLFRKHVSERATKSVTKSVTKLKGSTPQTQGLTNK